MAHPPTESRKLYRIGGELATEKDIKRAYKSMIGRRGAKRLTDEQEQAIENGLERGDRARIIAQQANVSVDVVHKRRRARDGGKPTRPNLDPDEADA